jgi:polar amino acid transport system substrate-binding protein
VTRRWPAGALGGVLAVGLVWASAGARPLDVIRERGLLSLCAHANALPFASKTQDPPGFQIELARALAQELGVTLQVEWVTSGFHFRVADCDIVLDTIAVPEVQAERRLQLSKAYQRSGVGLALRRDITDVAGFEDLAGRRVAVQTGSLAAMLLAKRGARLSSFGHEEDMVDAVVKGEVDAAAVSPSTVGYFIFRHPEVPVRFVHAYDAEPELRWNLAVGLRRADPPFREAIDRALERLMAEGTVGRIYGRYGIEHRPPLSR